MIARLCSRIGWLQDGDANAKLFHLHSRHRKRKNFIANIAADGQILTNHEDKARAANDFYENLFGTNLNRDHSINLEELGTVVHNLADLERPFTEDEMWATVKKLPSDKAPGPDGFTSRFYKTCWPIIKEDIMSAMSAIWSRKFRDLRCSTQPTSHYFQRKWMRSSQRILG
jgi:hypothetical protein